MRRQHIVHSVRLFLLPLLPTPVLGAGGAAGPPLHVARAFMWHAHARPSPSFEHEDSPHLLRQLLYEAPVLNPIVAYRYLLQPTRKLIDAMQQGD